MSKKQKAAGKAGSRNGGKKATSPVKKKAAPARTASAKKPVKKGKPAKSKPVAKAVKKLATKALKAVTKNKTKPSSAKPVKKEIGKKISKTIKKILSAAKNGKTVNKKNGSRGSEKDNNKKKASKVAALPIASVKSGKISPAPSKPVAAAVPASAKNSSPGKNGMDKKPIGREKPVADNRKLNDLFNKKQIERKPDEVLAITNTIPVKKKSELSASKIASISNSITNPVRKTDSYSVKAEKEPAGKFEMEFVVHASAEMLYEFLSTASGLSEWFCDDLNIRNGIYTFIWDDQLQQARLLKTVDQQLVRFQWVDKTDGSYFEFRIQRDDLTNDISLIITDFADTQSERESSKLLWNSQVEKLMHVIGSIF